MENSGISLFVIVISNCYHLWVSNAQDITDISQNPSNQVIRSSRRSVCKDREAIWKKYIYWLFRKWN